MFHTLPIRTAGKSSDQEKPSANDCNCEGGIKTSTPGIRKRTAVHQYFDEDLRRLERLATLHQRLQVETYGGLEEGVSKQADALIKPLNHLLQIGAISESSAILYVGRLADVRETILRQRFPVGIFWMNDDFSTCVDSIMATLMCAMNGDLIGCKIAWDFDPLTALEKLEELDRKIATQNIFGGILGATVSHRLQYLIGQQIDRELDQGDNLICAGNPTSATVGESVPFGTGAVKSFPGAPIWCKEHNLHISHLKHQNAESAQILCAAQKEVENLKLKVKHLNGREHQLKKALAQATGKPKDAISQKPPASHATGPSAQPDSKHNSSSTTTKVTPTSSASFQSGLYPTNIGWISPYDDDVTSRGMNPAPPNSPTSIPPTIHHESGGGRARPEGPLSTLNIQDVLRDQVSHESGYSRNSGYRTGGRWKFGQPSYRG